jgi:hypothetical protein
MPRNLTFALTALSCLCFASTAAGAACMNGGNFQTNYNGQTCTIGDMTFSNFSVGGVMGMDVSVNVMFANGVATITFGFSAQGTPVLSEGSNQTGTATFSYGVATAANMMFTMASVAMNDTVSMGGTASLSKTINPGNVALTSTDGANGRGGTPMGAIGGMAITVSETATAMGNGDPGGAADIISITDTFTEAAKAAGAPEPGTLATTAVGFACLVFLCRRRFRTTEKSL